MSGHGERTSRCPSTLHISLSRPTCFRRGDLTSTVFWVFNGPLTTFAVSSSSSPAFALCTTTEMSMQKSSTMYTTVYVTTMPNACLTSECVDTYTVTETCTGDQASRTLVRRTRRTFPPPSSCVTSARSRRRPSISRAPIRQWTRGWLYGRTVVSSALAWPARTIRRLCRRQASRRSRGGAMSVFGVVLSNSL